MSINKLTQALKDIQKLKVQNEYRTSTYKGVSGLSRSDLETIEHYITWYQREGNIAGLMPLYGDKAIILTQLGLQ